MAPERTAQNGHGISEGDRLEIEAFELRQRLATATHEAASFVRRYPLECLAGALAVGFLVGRVVSRRF